MEHLPDIWQIIIALSSVGVFASALRIESRITRIETILKIK